MRSELQRAKIGVAERLLRKYVAAQVRTALAEGVLIRPNHCESCGLAPKGKTIHAHHDDYGRPLAVRWLCFKCHMEHHKVTQSAAFKKEIRVDVIYDRGKVQGSRQLTLAQMDALDAALHRHDVSHYVCAD